MNSAREVVVTSDTLGESCSATVWDPTTGSLLSAYKNASTLGFHTLQILSNSYILAADSNKPRLYLWPLNSQTPVPNLRLITPGKVTAMTCTPNGMYIVAAVDEKLFIWQLSTGRLLNTLTRHYQKITCLMFNGDGSRFASGAEDGLVFVWSLVQVASQQRSNQQATPIHSFSDHSLPVKDLHFDQFGLRARLISVSLDRTARIYDSAAGTLLLTLVFDVPLTSVCTDIREKNLFVGCSDGTISQFNLHEPPRGIEHHISCETSSSNNSAIFRGHKAIITCLSVSTDCRTLLSGCTDGAVHLWDIPSRQIVRTIQHKGSITTALFVRAFDNFRTNHLKPTLQVRSLQRVTEECNSNDFIEIISRRDTTKFLDIEYYLEKGTLNDDYTSKSSDSLAEEVERLKTINAAMYQQGVKSLLARSNVQQ